MSTKGNLLINILSIEVLEKDGIDIHTLALFELLIHIWLVMLYTL